MPRAGATRATCRSAPSEPVSPTSTTSLGRVLALYVGGTGYCSELTALRPDTGVRAAAAQPRRPARYPAAGRRHVRGRDRRGLPGGRPLRSRRDPRVRRCPDAGAGRPAAAHGLHLRLDALIASGRLGVVERCPDESTDRLTVLSPDGSEGAEKPQRGVLGPAARGRRHAGRAVRRPCGGGAAGPGPPAAVRPRRRGRSREFRLDVPDVELTRRPAGRSGGRRGRTAERSTGGRDRGRSRWTAPTLTPRWTVGEDAGPRAARTGEVCSSPCADGLLEVDPATGAGRRTLPVARDDPAAPVRPAAAGEVLLEQRGPELVALVPAP